MINQLRDKGIGVLITDHAAREILGTVERCYVIYQGQVLIDGSPDEVKQHPKVREEYLGNLDEPAARAAAAAPAAAFHSPGGRWRTRRGVPAGGRESASR